MARKLPYEPPDLQVLGSVTTLTLDTGGDDCNTAPGKCPGTGDHCDQRSRIASIDGGASGGWCDPNVTTH